MMCENTDKVLKVGQFWDMRLVECLPKSITAFNLVQNVFFLIKSHGIVILLWNVCHTH